MLKVNNFIKEIPEQPKTVCDLKEGDVMCWLGGDRSLYKGRWSNSRYDNLLRNLGDVFLTQKEAEKELVRRQAVVTLRSDTKGFKLGKKPVIYYTVRYDIGSQSFSVEEYDSIYKWSYMGNPFVFSSREDAEKSIKLHEKEWKTYLGVEEE